MNQPATQRTTRTVAGILHFLTREQMAEEIVRLDAVLAKRAATAPAAAPLPCDDCAGTGKYSDGLACDDCGGTGRGAPASAPLPLTDALEEFDHQLSSWARAYPESVFPEPDMTLVRTALEARGITIDSVSASNMRHVATTLNKLFEPVRAALSGGSPEPVSGSEGEEEGGQRA